MYRDTSEWLEDCPLRRWRLSRPKPMGRNEAARLLDVHRTSMSNWERGIWPPNEIDQEAITRLTGITRQQWREWLAKRPVEAESVNK